MLEPTAQPRQPPPAPPARPGCTNSPRNSASPASRCWPRSPSWASPRSPRPRRWRADAGRPRSARHWPATRAAPLRTPAKPSGHGDRAATRPAPGEGGRGRATRPKAASETRRRRRRGRAERQRTAPTAPCATPSPPRPPLVGGRRSAPPVVVFAAPPEPAGARARRRRKAAAPPRPGRPGACRSRHHRGRGRRGPDRRARGRPRGGRRAGQRRPPPPPPRAPRARRGRPPGRRRRRRGRRGRRGRGREADEPRPRPPRTAATPESGAERRRRGREDGGDEGGESASTRRRRRRRRSGTGPAAETGEDDPADTVVHVRPPREPAQRGGGDRSGGRGEGDDGVRGVKGSTRLEAKRQRRRDGRDTGRRRPPILTEAEFLARREAVDRVMAVRQTRRPHPDRRARGRRARRALRHPRSSAVLRRQRLPRPGAERAAVAWRRRSSTSARAATACSTPARSTGTPPGLEGKSRAIENALKSGDAVLVQVTKDPIGHKGARLTSQISLPGRFLVYVPGGGMTGISRKLPDTERHRLKTILKKIVPEDAGVIVRTAAEGASEEELTRDVERLKAQWEAISAKAARHEVGADPAARRARPGDPGRPRRLQRGLPDADRPGRRRLADGVGVRRRRRARPGRAGLASTPATATCSTTCASTSS